MYRTLLLPLLLASLSFTIQAQINCSVNAGTNENFCLFSIDEFTLFGGVSGDFDISTIEWSIIQQPTGSNLEINNPKSLIATTTKPVVEGTYTFMIYAKCGLGEATQTVSYELFKLPSGSLSFPDLDCVELDALIEVQKVFSQGTEFRYSFVESGLMQIVAEDDQTLTLAHGSGTCFPEKITNMNYTLVNAGGCELQKTATFDVPFIYPQDSIRMNLVASCVYFDPGCVVDGDILWEIVSQPSYSNAVFLDPNEQIGKLCGIVDSCYTISFTLSDSECNDRYSEVTFCGKEDFAVSVERRRISFCDYPSSFILRIESDDLPHICLDLEQVFGPTLNVFELAHGEWLLSGFMADERYGIRITELNKINGCERIWEFRLDDDRDGLVENVDLASWPISSCGFHCSNWHSLLSDGGFDGILEEMTLSIELISHPPQLDLDLGFIFGVEGGDFFFDRNNQFVSQYRQIMNLNNGFRFNLCSDVPKGLYVFNISITGECFEYEKEIIFQLTPKAGEKLLNAGTDQVLPCEQDTTRLIGNSLDPFEGFWSVYQSPPGVPNPVEGDETLAELVLTNLEAGLYVFRYNIVFPIENSVCQNTDLLYDEVSVLVTDSIQTAVIPLLDDVFCQGEIIEIPIPIDLPMASIVQGNGPPLDISISTTDNVIVINDAAPFNGYQLIYGINNECVNFNYVINFDVLDANLDPAIIENEDECYELMYDVQQRTLVAQDIPNSNGEWTYEGLTDVIFDPDEFSPVVDVSFVMTELKAKFIWTVSSDDCPNTSQDEWLYYYLPRPSFNGDLNYIDCSTSFPDTLMFDIDDLLSDFDFGPEYSWSFISTDANQLPSILTPGVSQTKIVFYDSGTYSFAITVDYGIDCVGNEGKFSHIFDVKLSQPGSIAYAGSDTETCEKTVQLAAAEITVGEGSWLVVSSFPSDLMVSFDDPNDPNAIATFDRPGTVILQWQVSGEIPDCGTSSFDEIEIVVHDFELYFDENQFCDVESYILDHSFTSFDNINFVQISGPSQIDFQSIDEFTTAMLNIETGYYEVEYSYQLDSLGCSIEGVFNFENFSDPIQDTIFTKSQCLIEDISSFIFPLDFTYPDFDLVDFDILSKPFGAIDADKPLLNLVDSTFQYDGYNVGGEYIFTYQLDNGICSYFGVYAVTIISTPNYFIEDQFILCSEDEIIDLEIQNVDFDINSIEWLDEDGNVVSTESQLSINSDQLGSYTIAIEFGEDCFDTLYTQIVISDLAIGIEAVAEPSSIDLGGSSQLSLLDSLDADCQITWEPSESLDDAQTENPLASPLVTTLYIATIVKGDCTTFDSVLVEVCTNDFSIDDQFIICDNEEMLDLQIQNFNSDAQSIEWLDQDGNVINVTNELSVDCSAIGIYAIAINYGQACFDTLYTEVICSELAAGIEAIAEPSFIEYGATSQLSLLDSLDADCEISWDPAETLDDATIANPLANPLETTIYTATIVKGACTTFDTVLVQVRALCQPEQIQIPNMFTPNGDGMNDVFQVEGEYDQLYMIIYNRWGEEMAKLDNGSRTWDGTFEGESLPVDVYGYKLRVSYCDGEEEEIPGNVLLMR